MKDVLRILTDNEERLKQTETKEVPGDTGFSAFYAKGTWTPVFQGTGTAGTFTYIGQTGTYTRIGNQVFIHGYVQISAITVAPTGNMQIIGLPFTAASSTDYSLAIGFLDNFNESAGCIQVTALVRNGTAQIWIGEVFDTAAWARFPATQFTTGTEGIEISGFYKV